MAKKLNLNHVLLGFSIFLVTLGWFHPLFLIFKTDMPPQYVVNNHLFSDDTFYYLEIGRNIVEKSISSFDGITRTNGYQPLWMVLLTLLGYLFPFDSLAYSITLIFIIITFVVLGAYSFYRLQKEYFPTHFNYFATVSYTFSALFIARLGMETCLIFLFFPFFIHVCVRCATMRKSSDAFLAGILGSLLILSRLDISILIVLICSAIFFYSIFFKKSKFSVRFALALLAGFLPVVIYVAINRIAFGQFFPYSGIAKSLHTNNFVFSQQGFASVIKTILHEKYLLIFYLFSLVSLPFSLLHFKKEKRIIDLLGIVILLFPYFFFGFYFFMSDWPLWLWYFYPLSLSFSFSMLFMEDYFVNRKIPLRITSYLIAIFTIGLFAFVVQNYVSHINEKFTPGLLLNVALKIKDFAAAHPGIYAMGDRAGIVSFLLPDPLIQLEGLVSDESMIENISAQRDLREALLSYGVNYYISSLSTKIDSCVDVSEPSQPGPFAPRMRMRLCEESIYFYNGVGNTAIYQISPNNP